MHIEVEARSGIRLKGLLFSVLLRIVMYEGKMVLDSNIVRSAADYSLGKTRSCNGTRSLSSEPQNKLEKRFSVSRKESYETFVGERRLELRM